MLSYYSCNIPMLQSTLQPLQKADIQSSLGNAVYAETKLDCS